jgi:hypothetical protein
METELTVCVLSRGLHSPTLLILIRLMGGVGRSLWSRIYIVSNLQNSELVYLDLE